MDKLRTDHPDFSSLMDVIQTMDESATSEEEMEKVLATACDPRSITYVSLRRALRTLAIGGEPIVLCSTAWIDGFIAGTRFQQYKELDKQLGTDVES